MSKKRYPLLTISSEIEQPYNYSLGRYGGRLVTELKDKRGLWALNVLNVVMSMYLPGRYAVNVSLKWMSL